MFRLQQAFFRQTIGGTLDHGSLFALRLDEPTRAEGWALRPPHLKPMIPV
jgi:hypothetical protein